MAEEPLPAKSPWYLGVPSVIAALLLLGPLAFPLLWKSPKFNSFWKIFLTVAIIAMTLYMIAGTAKMVEYVMQEFRKVQQTYSP